MGKRLARAAAAILLGFAAACANGQTATRPFSALRPSGGAAAAAHALVVELSPREALSGVHIELAPAAAPPPGSRYIVWVNGAPVADIEASEARERLALSPRAFTPGVNSIQLALVPRAAPITAEMAQTDLAPIDDARSTVSLDFAGLRPNTAPKLAQIPLAFDARAWLPRTVTVDLGHASISPEQLRAATLAVQSVAARLRQVDVTVAYRSERTIVDWGRDRTSWGIAQEAVRAGDVLLVGTRTALADALPESVARAITGPFLGIYPANDGKSVVVVLSGITDADCVRAAQAFADPTAAFPARATATIDSTAAVRAPARQVAIALADPNPALVRATLNFAAVHARATGAISDFAVQFSTDAIQTNFFFGRDAALSPRLRRHLPVYAPLQPGQAVSLPASFDGQPFIALVGANEASVTRAVSMLRRPANWSLFTQRATLFDTRADSAIPLVVAARSPIAAVRLFLANPETFWSILAALLFVCFIFVNAALKAQVAQRLDAAGRRPSRDTPTKP